MPTREEAKAAAVAAPTQNVDAPVEQVAAPTEAKPAKAPKEPKAKAEPTECKCGVPDHDKTGAEATGDAVKFPGCRGGKSTRKFAPGHDAKLVGFATRLYVAGKATADEAVELIRSRSGGSALLVSKIKSAVKREDDARTARERRVQAEKDAKATEPVAENATPEAKVDEVAAAQ